MDSASMTLQVLGTAAMIPVEAVRGSADSAQSSAKPLRQLGLRFEGDVDVDGVAKYHGGQLELL